MAWTAGENCADASDEICRNLFPPLCTISLFEDRRLDRKRRYNQFADFGLLTVTSGPIHATGVLWSGG